MAGVGDEFLLPIVKGERFPNYYYYVEGWSHFSLRYLPNQQSVYNFLHCWNSNKMSGWWHHGSECNVQMVCVVKPLHMSHRDYSGVPTSLPYTRKNLPILFMFH